MTNTILSNFSLVCSSENDDETQNPGDAVTIPQLLTEVLEPQLNESAALREKAWMVDFQAKKTFKYMDIIPGMKR